MGKPKVVMVMFKEILQDGQDLGGGDEFMVSRIFFDLCVPGQDPVPLHVDVKQTVGSDYVTGSIEVGAPSYEGTWNAHAFHDAAETYYRKTLARFIQGGRGSRIRMRNNRFVLPEHASFEVGPG
jgi:hypothetical protein